MMRMLAKISIALPEDTNIRALYLPDRRLLCVNECAAPDAKLIVIWRIRRDK